MKKKILIMLFGVLLGGSPMIALAAEGNVQINLPEGMEGEVVKYGKEGEEKKEVVIGKENSVNIENLENGTYEIEIPETSEYEFSKSLIQVPTWDEEEQSMNYKITVNPKYIQKVKAPDTGDKNKEGLYVGLAVISLIIVAIMTCHNRFKCGRMFGKYSKKRRI